MRARGSCGNIPGRSLPACPVLPFRSRGALSHLFPRSLLSAGAFLPFFEQSFSAVPPAGPSGGCAGAIAEPAGTGRAARAAPQSSARRRPGRGGGSTRASSGLRKGRMRTQVSVGVCTAFVFVWFRIHFGSGATSALEIAVGPAVAPGAGSGNMASGTCGVLCGHLPGNSLWTDHPWDLLFFSLSREGTGCGEESEIKPAVES